MAVYSIKEVEQLTRIKAHTLRVWERRYNVCASQRTDTNIRIYDEKDLRYLLQTSLLISHGHKISHIAKMSDAERHEHVQNTYKEVVGYETYIQRLLLGMIALDEHDFDEVIQECFAQKGVESSMQEVIFPFLERIGLLWITGNVNPANEHFISNLIRQKLIAALDALPIPQMQPKNNYILFLPEGELHELTLLYLNYMLRVRGNHTLYLGQNTPHADVEKTLQYYPAKYIFTILTAPPMPDTETFLAELERWGDSHTMTVAGRVVQEVNPNDFPKIKFLYGAASVAIWIEENSERFNASLRD